MAISHTGITVHFSSIKGPSNSMIIYQAIQQHQRYQQ